jgi:hypothetical protein
MTEVKRRPGRKKRVKRINPKSPEMAEKMSLLMKSPEQLAKRMEGLRKWVEVNGRPCRMVGQPDGVGIVAFRKIKAKAEVKAERAIKIMAEKDIWQADNDVASKAMKTAVEIMELGGETRTRLAAAKTILDFVQSKPVQKNETTLKNAEAFLEALVQEEGNES